MFCYTFTNFYLSSIQQGIQAAHAQHELFLKYSPFLHVNPEVCTSHDLQMQHKAKILYDWANKYKTIVVLNGGDNFALQDLVEFLCDKQNNSPFAHWRESEGALGGSQTAVSIIPDSSTFDLIRKYKRGTILLKEFRNKNGWEVTDLNRQMIEPISKFRGDLIRRIAKAELAR